MNTNFFSLLSTRWFKALAVLLVLGGYGMWFMQNERKLRNEAWDGVITEQWEKKPLWVRDSSGPLDYDAKQRRRTKHYWRVQRDDGQVVEVKVPAQLYASAGPGKRVKKIFNERYPRLQ